MAGSTFVTQEAAALGALTSYSTRVTQAALTLGAVIAHSTRMTQSSLGASTWTAFLTRMTQTAIVPWVITCSSTSYVPPAPTGLITLTATPGATGHQWVDLAWNAVAGMTYTLKRGTVGGTYPVTLLTSSTALTYHDTSVVFNTQYFYLVTGTNPCSDQTVSNEATATPGCNLPGRPLRLNAVANQTAGTIDLIWNAVVDPDA